MARTIPLFTVRSDSSQDRLSEWEMIDRYRAVLSDNDLEALARWLWHADEFHNPATTKVGDTL